MNKPHIFLGSAEKQAELVEAITQGLEDVADVEPWMTTFNPGRSTPDRLVELSKGGRFRGTSLTATLPVGEGPGDPTT